MVAFFNFKGMAVKSVQFKGIVRNLSPLNNVDGSCEEVINLRLDSGAWRVVGKKRRILKNVDYDQVYVHKYGAFENYIGVKDGRVTWFGSVVDGVVVSKEQEVCKVNGGVVFGSLSNILLVKDEDRVGKAVFTNGCYEVSIEMLPEPPAAIANVSRRDEDVGEPVYTKMDVHWNNSSEMESARELIRGLIGKLKSDNPGYEEGRVFLCATYELFDGTETKPSAPLCLELGEFVPGVFRSKEDSPNDGGHISASVRITDFPLSKLQVRNYSEVDEKYKDVVRKVNVYVTLPISHFDVGNIDPTKVISESATASLPYAIPERELKLSDVEKMLFFRVASFASDFYGFVDVDFSTLTTNETMPVDSSGWISTVGDMFVYNKRLHLFNLKQRFESSDYLGYAWKLPSEHPNFPHPSRDLCAFVYVKTRDNELVLRYDFQGAWVDKVSGGMTVKFPKVVAFPDSRAYQIVFYDKEHKFEPVTVKLSASVSYNFALGVVENTSVPFGLDSKPVDFPAVVDCYEDGANIIVSEVANPYFFPPEHSYLAPGEVVAMAVANDQISESQVGQYPLYVFTTEGVYALQVGEGKVLYSNIIPISAEVATGGVLQTKYGIVFVTGSGLKLISGRDVVDVSEPICGRLEGSLRESKDFRGITNHELLYDARLILSAVPFEEYVKGAVMGYDLRKDELIVSNAVYGYSYVFGLKSRVWHKITEVFESFNRYVGLMREGDGCSVCDVREEEDCVQVVHLHTRPMCLNSYGFKKMTHVLFRGEFKPNDKRHGVYVFGSNGLDDWRCVADGQFVVDRCHVPLARIFYSFRYFAIVCGGEVRPGHLVTHVDFDGEVMFDNRMR